MQDRHMRAPGALQTGLASLGWPAVLLASAGLAVLAGTFQTDSDLKLAVMLWFLIVCPGMAYVRLLGISDALAECILAIGLSLVLDVSVAGLLVYGGRWQTQLAVWAVAGLTTFGALAQTPLFHGVPRLARHLTKRSHDLWLHAPRRTWLATPSRRVFGAAAAVGTLCVAATVSLAIRGSNSAAGHPSSDAAAPVNAIVAAPAPQRLYDVDALAGGVVEAGDVTISIPAGAFGAIPGPATVSVDRLSGDVPLPDGAPYIRPGGSAVRLIMTDPTGAHLATTARPIAIQLKYSEADLQAAGGDASLLTAAYLVQADTPPIANPLRFPIGTWVFFPPSLSAARAQSRGVFVTTQAVSSVMAVVVRPFTAARVIAAETGLYSGPGQDAVLFGTRPRESVLQVVGPVIGGRLLVFDPETANYAYVDAADVAPDAS